MSKNKFGLMWLDKNNERSIAVKVNSGACYYLDKYGLRANVCYLHPSMVGREFPMSVNSKVGMIELRADAGIQPNNFYLCVEEGKS